jgi:hypothetical protein
LLEDAPMLLSLLASLLCAGPAPAVVPENVATAQKLAAIRAALPVPQPPLPACSAPLPKPRAGPVPWPTGEKLTYDIDVMGATAGRMTFDVLPAAGKAASAEIPVHVSAESNTFFNKVRKVKGEVTSWLRPRDLHPSHFHEDLAENAMTRAADVVFGDRSADIAWRSNNSTQGNTHPPTGPDALDYVGGIYLFRSIPLRVGQPFCFDVYGIKRMWRLEGKVEAREHVSLPAGEFDAYHLSGIATSLTGNGKREVHVWISDDARHLPLAAVGVIDLGPVRAQLVEITRPDLKSATAKPNLEW